MTKMVMTDVVVEEEAEAMEEEIEEATETDERMAVAAIETMVVATAEEVEAAEAEVGEMTMVEPQDGTKGHLTMISETSKTKETAKGEVTQLKVEVLHTALIINFQPQQLQNIMTSGRIVKNLQNLQIQSSI